MNTLATVENQQTKLVDTKATALPAAAYLASLRTAVSKAGIESALNTAAEIVSGERNWRAVDWSRLNAAVAKAIMA